MKKVFITMVAVFALFFIVSCGDDSKNDTDWGNQDSEVNDEDSSMLDESEVSDLSEDFDMSEVSDQSDETGDLDTEVPDEDTAVDPLLAQFAGTWAEKIILKSSSSSMIKNVPSVTTRYILVDMTIKDGKLEINRRNGVMCQTDNETGNNIANKGVVGFNEPNSKFNSIYHFWKPNQIPGQETMPDVNITKDGDKIKFVTNREWELRGANMTNPATEEMITADSDSRIFDHDGDTKPAFTITFSGIVNGPIYYVQRLTTIFDGELITEKKIEGHVDWTDEQYTHQSTPDTTLKGQKTTVTDKDNSVFQFVKVADTMNCTDMLAQKSTLFDLVNPNKNPDGDPNTDN
ncbi:MAG TPA: hypothetical protein PKG52_02635 [bacterium]|nr:hypothetical protein [bacterium]HPS29496.1 hypothetical protein [bacterium]